MQHSVVVHAHLYQPPREDPWSGAVLQEASAAPFHDWNERITHECYRPLAQHLNQISFNVGATLFEWLDQAAPDVVQAILQADRESAARLGHGNAIAMPYHHLILPLASRRDQEIEVRWGIRDFERRYGRKPDGLWLPETAVNLESLDVLAAAGIKFTILAPHQVEAVPLFGLPGVVRTGPERRLAVFIYEGRLSQEVAFGGLIKHPSTWVQRLRLPPDDVGSARLVSLATDGETYGHHHAVGINSLVKVLKRIRSGAVVENYASFLARNPPRQFVRLVENTSWSCPHGIERWRSNCGCRLKESTTQQWRAPLREGLDELRGGIDLLLGARGAIPPEEPGTAQQTLPMDWHARRMLSSCGWFFDDIGGIESRISLAHAVRSIDLAGEEGPRLLTALRERLASAVSNDPTVGNGAAVLEAILARQSSTIDAH